MIGQRALRTQTDFIHIRGVLDGQSIRIRDEIMRKPKVDECVIVSRVRLRIIEKIERVGQITIQRIAWLAFESRYVSDIVRLHVLYVGLQNLEDGTFDLPYVPVDIVISLL